MTELRIIDAHAQLWDQRQRVPKRSRLGRLLGGSSMPDPWWPDTLQTEAGSLPVVGAVYVESMPVVSAPQALLFEPAALDRYQSPPLGIVARADFGDDDRLEEQLDSLSLATGRLRGVRTPLIHSERPAVLSLAPAFAIDSDEFRRGLELVGQRQLSFDAWCYHHQLEALNRAVSDVGPVPILLDHAGLPTGLADARTAVKAQAREEWRAGLVALAAQPNVWCQISGFSRPDAGYIGHEQVSTAQLVETLASDILFTIQTFGPQRCMFGSDFPMGVATVSYSQLWEVFEEVTDGVMSDAQREALFAGNAASFYRLERMALGDD